MVKSRVTFLIAFLIFNICIGQVYKFDTEVKFKFFTSEIRVNYFNSTDFSYHMQIYPQNDSIKARIFDTNYYQVHNFYIDVADSLKIKYLNSYDVPNQPNPYIFKFSDLKMVKGEQEMIFEVFKKKKRRKAKYKLIVEKTDGDNFQIFKTSCLEEFLFTKIVTPFNFRVLKAEGINTSDNFVEYELKSITDINVRVTIPQT